MNKKIIHLPITDFAIPAPRRGSIDAHSGLGRASQAGIEIHQKVQLERAQDFSDYEAEVAVEHEFETEDYIFRVGGRMDGVFRSEKSFKIEEIKTSFNIFDLMHKLRESQDDHPYCLQLLTYGYIQFQASGRFPELRLHLVSTRNGETADLSLRLNLDEYEAWLKRRLGELVDEAHAEEKRIERRKKAAAAFQFPFERPRPGQVELIQQIEEGMKDAHPMMFQAPTGLGKTIGVMYPTLKEALARGQKLIYITPKNSQHAVAEDAVTRLQEEGAKLKSLTITAKSKMCMKNEPLCNPDYCEFARDHYTKVSEHRLVEELRKKRKLTAKTFKKIAESHTVCPFELQLDAAADVDTVICDYNYVFAPRSAFGRLAKEGLVIKGKPNLVIDEAHNLPGRAIDMYSPQLSVFALLKLREEGGKLPGKFAGEFLAILNSCIAVVQSCGNPGQAKAHEIEPPIESFMLQDVEVRQFLSAYLASDIEIPARDPVLSLAFSWSEFTGALEYVMRGNEAEGAPRRFFTTYTPNPGTVKITCCDASAFLRESYDDFAQVVAFSATLKPFEYYAKLSGLEGEGLKTAEFVSPFDPVRRKLLVIPQISSKYSERERNYPRIAETIARVVKLKKGNYVAFFPSFDFMERTLAQFEAPEGFRLLRQERFMKRDDVDEVLERLADPAFDHLLFAVQGGVFSEGVDYPGRMLIGAFVVGPPLPSFDLEREKMREYYEKNYQAGFDYAYTYPAMAKAVQSAGRVIRSETDRGLIVLMDNRFLDASYSKSMPSDWFRTHPSELVSNRILAEIREFWEGEHP
ncbi:MAG: DEAD/DEAH box helicase family protein [Bdellovibrionaceae bacterium]|nr:DEAD/DEAH box helicase family protein [Pseudobdellovibrionaceae bacterium]